MKSESGIRSTHVVAGAVLGLALIESYLLLLSGFPANSAYLTLVWFVPSGIAALGVLLTRERTPTFRFASGCCLLVCFGSLIAITIAIAEWIAPVGDFAIAGAVGVGWFVQIIPAGLSGVTGIGAWQIRRSRIAR